MIKFWELIVFTKTDSSKGTKKHSKKRYCKNLLKHTKKQKSKITFTENVSVY